MKTIKLPVWYIEHDKLLSKVAQYAKQCDEVPPRGQVETT